MKVNDKIKDNVGKVKDVIEKVKGDNNRKLAEDTANIIILGYSLAYYVVKTPKAIKHKIDDLRAGKVDSHTSYFDYIDDPEKKFDYDKIVDKVTGILDKSDELQDKITYNSNLIFLIKSIVEKVIDKIKQKKEDKLKQLPLAEVKEEGSDTRSKAINEYDESLKVKEIPTKLTTFPTKLTTVPIESKKGNMDIGDL